MKSEDYMTHEKTRWKTKKNFFCCFSFQEILFQISKSQVRESDSENEAKVLTEFRRALTEDALKSFVYLH